MVEYGELRATLSAQGNLGATVQPGTGGGGTTDYELLENKPQINNIELIGNKSLPDLGIVNNVQADWNETDSTAEDFIKNKPSIPTKTSDLDNNSNFVSDAAYVHTDNNYTTEEKEKLEDIQEGAEVNVQADWNEANVLSDSYIQNKPTIPTVNNNTVTVQKNGQNVDSFTLNQNTDKNINITVPTKTSDIQNDSGFIQNTVNNLANYYLKSETYTQAEVQALVNSAVNGRFEKVTVLPETGERNVIYLVPKNPAQTNNSYDEYIWQDNAWELLGSTDIDLSGYVTTTALTEALQNYVTTSALNTLIANYYTKTEVGTLLDRKVDKETGKGLSANDYSAEEKSKVSTAYDHSQDASRVTSAIATGLYKVGATAQGHISELSAVVKADLTGLGVADNDDVTALDGRVDTIEAETDDNSTTVTGNPLSFTTESAQLASDCDITLNPIQDLHGYDKPWVGGAGKNLIPMTVDVIKAINTGGTWSGNVYTWRGITYTIITDSDNNVIGIGSNGTADGGAANFALVQNMDIAVGTDYALNGCPSGGMTNTYALAIQNANGDWIGADYDIGSGSTINKGVKTIVITVSNGTNVNNKTWYPMVRLATESDATFAPYTNICPISGRASVDLVENGDTITFTFGSTVYGGTIDVRSGVVTVDKAFNSDLSQLTWNKRATVTNKWEFYALLNTMKVPTSSSYLADMKCSIYKIITADQAYNGNGGFGIAAGIYNGNGSLYVYDDTISELTDFQNAMSGVQLCYELATPTIIQLTPHEVALLTGANTISTDGDSITITYKDGKFATREDLVRLYEGIKAYIDYITQ